MNSNLAQSTTANLNSTQFALKEVFWEKEALSSNEYYLLKSNSEVISHRENKDLYQVVRVLGNNNFIIKPNKSYLLKSAKSNSLGKIYTVNNLWKLNDNLLKLYNDATSFDTKLDVVINTAIQAKLIKGQKSPFLKNYYQTSLTLAEINDLMNSQSIIYIGLEDFNVHSDATVLDLNLHPNRVNAVHYQYPTIKGQTELVSIQEPTYDTADIDLRGRFLDLPYKSSFSDNHATEMATIIAGNGNSFITGHGVATATRHTSADNALIVPQEPSYYIDNNILVQNHSFGTSVESFYGSLAAAYDEHITQNPFVLHVQSSGNSGLDIPRNGIYDGIAGASNLTGNFKQAKNVLTVGSVDTTANHAFFSSSGPAYDGRIKPELVTYSVGGTSNSAALISGSVILLQQFAKSLYNKPMEAALIKAILINTADEAGALGIDFLTGFGQLNALSAMETVESGNFISDTITIGEQLDFEENIPENAVNFKATLVWTDLPANPNDAASLVNDLDMIAIDMDGINHFPTILNSAPTDSLLNQLPTTGPDHLNNIEQINIPSPSQGTIKLSVLPYSLVSESQAFHIAYQYDLQDTFRWTSPTAIDNIPYNGETISHLRWESSFGNKEGALAYRLMSQANDWITIDNNIKLNEEQKRWNNPLVNDLAQLKMSIGNETFLSDTFTISTPLKMVVNFSCADSIMLSWNALQNADQYVLSNLRGSKMDVLEVLEDTSIIIRKTNISSDFFNITPIVDSKRMISSFTIDYKLQGAFCFLKSYFSYVKQDSGVFIELTLGTTQFVENLVLEKQIGNKWVDYMNQNATATQLRFHDKSPDNGLNFYRVKVKFTNNTTLQSEELAAFFVKDKPFVIYPNPISTDEDLKVLGREVNSLHTFELITSNGHKVLTYRFDDDRAYVELPPTLKEGLYIYHIFTEDGSVSTGKLLIKN